MLWPPIGPGMGGSSRSTTGLGLKCTTYGLRTSPAAESCPSCRTNFNNGEAPSRRITSGSLLFPSNRAGAEVYVQAFDSTPSPHLAGERREVSSNGAWLVRWRADGRELFYLGLDNILYAVPVLGPLEFGQA